MNYLIPRFNCSLASNNIYNLKKDVKYKLGSLKNFMLLGLKKETPRYISINETTNILKVEYGEDVYYVINPIYYCNVNIIKLKHNGFEYFLSISGCLSVTCNNENILLSDIEELSFSHTETYSELLIVYLVGTKNYIIILEKGKVLYAGYYDECNFLTNEILFMCKMNDSLNHGKVLKIKNNKFEEYLVYLDDSDLCLKTRFVGFVFLDCLLAKNFNYCNQLLREDIKQKEGKNIALFFPKFDYYFETEPNTFVLIEKNALAGIYKFEIENLVITNIIQQHH